MKVDEAFKKSFKKWKALSDMHWILHIHEAPPDQEDFNMYVNGCPMCEYATQECKKNFSKTRAYKMCNHCPIEYTGICQHVFQRFIREKNNKEKATLAAMVHDKLLRVFKEEW